MTEFKKDNPASRRAWNANAAFWDERMAEGNDFFNLLAWPAVEELLGIVAGERVLDVACGNGVTSRRLFEAGATVTALDFAEELIALAGARRHGREIDYRAIDAADRDALVALGEAKFDAALCNMALMDMAGILPLFEALSVLLRPMGRFVFSIMHPCFNNPSTVHVAELEDREGVLEPLYSVKISRYLRSFTKLGAAMHDQPVPHPYFHRSMGDLIQPGLDSGFVVDGFLERAFPPGYEGGTTAVSWSGRYSEIPPVLAVRMRKVAGEPGGNQVTI